MFSKSIKHPPTCSQINIIYSKQHSRPSKSIVDEKLYSKYIKDNNIYFFKILELDIKDCNN